MQLSSLGRTCKLYCQLTSGSVQFRPVSFVLRNDKHSGLDRSAGQTAVAGWVLSPPYLSAAHILKQPITVSAAFSSFSPGLPLPFLINCTSA